MSEKDIERVMRYTGWAREVAMAAITQWRQYDPSWTSDYLDRYEEYPDYYEVAT